MHHKSKSTPAFLYECCNLQVIYLPGGLEMWTARGHMWQRSLQDGGHRKCSGMCVGWDHHTPSWVAELDVGFGTTAFIILAAVSWCLSLLERSFVFNKKKKRLSHMPVVAGSAKWINSVEICLIKFVNNETNNDYLFSYFYYGLCLFNDVHQIILFPGRFKLNTDLIAVLYPHRWHMNYEPATVSESGDVSKSGCTTKNINNVKPSQCN